MKISKNLFAMLPLLAVLVACEKAVASSFAAPLHNKELSHSSRRDLQQTCASGFTYNACANCNGCKFTTKAALQGAVNGYPANQATYGKMNCWDVSSITDMSDLFSYNSLNEPIGCWNVSSVTTMILMFKDATNFNQPIGNWNVSSVTDMYAMFAYATSFNQDLCSWYNKLPSTTTFTDYYEMYAIFDGTSCPNKSKPDLQVKASFCQACAPKPVPTALLPKPSAPKPLLTALPPKPSAPKPVPRAQVPPSAPKPVPTALLPKPSKPKPLPTNLVPKPSAPKPVPRAQVPPSAPKPVPTALVPKVVKPAPRVLPVVSKPLPRAPK